MKSIYEIDDAREIITWCILGREGREAEIPKAQLAAELDIKRTFFYAVLKGTKPISDSLAFSICDRFNFDESEKSYFFMLIKKEKASEDVKPVYETIILKLKREYEEKQWDSQIDKQESPLSQEFLEYYTKNWICQAIYFTAADPSVSTLTVDEIGKRLDLSRESIKHEVDFLIKHRMIDKKSLKSIPRNIFFPHDSEQARINNETWRKMIAHHLANSRQYSSRFHRSFIFQTRKEVAIEIEDLQNKFMDEVWTKLQDSPPEAKYKRREAYVLLVDFLPLTHGDDLKSS